MKTPPVDYVAVDTNVFGHITDSKRQKHIISLLSRLERAGTALLVDDQKVIYGEYNRHLSADLGKKGFSEVIVRLMRYWMDFAPRKLVAVNKGDSLFGEIRAVIPEEKEEVDRVFVYVAFKSDRVLVSNDTKHIVPRREALLEKTRQHRSGKKADILTSEEAAARV